jgi:hypothetical protein
MNRGLNAQQVSDLILEALAFADREFFCLVDFGVHHPLNPGLDGQYHSFGYHEIPTISPMPAQSSGYAVWRSQHVPEHWCFRTRGLSRDYYAFMTRGKYTAYVQEVIDCLVSRLETDPHGGTWDLYARQTDMLEVLQPNISFHLRPDISSCFERNLRWLAQDHNVPLGIYMEYYAGYDGCNFVPGPNGPSTLHVE